MRARKKKKKKENKRGKKENPRHEFAACAIRGGARFNTSVFAVSLPFSAFETNGPF